MLINRNQKIRQSIRKKDINILFSKLPENFFNKGLEIGGGDGFQSFFLTQYIKKLVSTDIDRKIVFKPPTSDIKYVIIDAENLEKHFSRSEFDLIFSSNTLEHINDIDKVMASFKLLLDQNGIMIHVMPNRLWVLFKVFLLPFSYFYNYLLTNIIRKKNLRNISDVSLNSKQFNNNHNVNNYTLNNQNMKKVGYNSNVYKKLIRFFWQPPHGVCKTNFQEFYSFGKTNWVRLFKKHGFNKILIKKMQCHSPHRFGFNKLRYLFEACGFCTCYAFIVCKGQQAEKNINLYFAKQD